MVKSNKTFYVEGLDCPDCARSLEKNLAGMKGVERAKLDFPTSKLKVEFGEGIKEIEIERELEKLGYKAKSKDFIIRIEEKKPFNKIFLTSISGIFLLTGFLFSVFENNVAVLLYLMAIVVGGYYIARKALVSVKTLNLDMNVLMGVAVLGAILIREYLEGATVVFLFSLAQLLESYSMDKARNAIRRLMEFSPNFVTLRRGGKEVEVSVENIKVGEIILTKPGERIGLDGVVVKGFSHVNQAPITGESLPIKKSKGDKVFAGTVNHEGILEIKVEREFKNTTLQRIIHMVEKAQTKKAPSQSFVDKFATYYTPTIIIFAIFTATIPPICFGEFSKWFYRSLVLLVISCPCALVISTPVTVVSGLTRAARNGVLIKGGLYLEEMGRLKVVAFDKTGTLTRGVPEVTEIFGFNSNSKLDVLKIAASIEKNSEHPIGKAILRYAEKRNVEIFDVEDFQSIPGRGAKAKIANKTYLVGSYRLFKGFKELNAPELKRGSTVVFVGNEKEILGAILASDEVRKEAEDAVQKIVSKGVEKVVMITGDNEKAAKAIAERVGVEYYAELLPEDKIKIVEELKKKYKKVCMVGDGVNDAPALAASSVGVAMGAAGTDIALETADIALMSDELLKIPYTMKLSKKSLRIIKENITLSLLIKGIFLGLAIFGIATLWMAVFADMGTSLMVIGNGMRVLRD
ncbi:MAG: heavy metal translocating P-type ATPase [Candidatus Methanofastidiosia archaeon]